MSRMMIRMYIRTIVVLFYLEPKDTVQIDGKIIKYFSVVLVVP